MNVTDSNDYITQYNQVEIPFLSNNYTFCYFYTFSVTIIENK